MLHPTFSVIIPAYNAEATLRSTASSVLLQSEPDFEMIIVDDGSTDATVLAMLEIGCKDMRVRVVSQPNMGVSAARNYGASMARGKYLAFLDADDQWNTTKLASHLRAHEGELAPDASFATVAFCTDQPGILSRGRSMSTVQNRQYSISDVIVENAVCTTSNLVIRRDVFEQVGGFDENLRYAEDQEFLVRLIGQGHRLCGIDRPLVKYRMSNDGLSCDFDAMLAGWRAFAAEWLDKADFKQAEAIYCRYLARRALRSGAHIDVARSFARRGLAADRDSFIGSSKLRAILTLGGLFAGGAMPTAMRRAVFA